MAFSDTLRRYEARNRRIRKLRSLGWTQERIAKRFGITPQRVYQILLRPER